MSSGHDGPAWFVLGPCHWRELTVNADEPLERPLRLWAHHFGVYVRQHAVCLF